MVFFFRPSRSQMSSSIFNVRRRVNTLSEKPWCHQSQSVLLWHLLGKLSSIQILLIITYTHTLSHRTRYPRCPWLGHFRCLSIYYSLHLQMFRLKAPMASTDGYKLSHMYFNSNFGWVLIHVSISRCPQTNCRFHSILQVIFMVAWLLGG